MIKINLLPKEILRREARKYGVIVFALSLLVVIVFVAVAYQYFYSQVSDLQARISSAKKEIQSLRSIRAEYLELKKQKAEIERRLATIENLRKGRALSARMLYDMSTKVNENIWLKSFKKSGSMFEIEGISAENDSISNFIEDLSKIPYVKNVELKKVEDATEQGVVVKKFILQGVASL